jgi:thymidylate synthase
MPASREKSLTAAPSELAYLTNPRVFGTAQEAWCAALTDLLAHGTDVCGVRDHFSVGSAFGNKERGTRELTMVGFALAAPRQRLICSAHRPVDLGYAIANTLWTFSGSDDAATISFYNPAGRKFSDDGVHLFAAPGARIFASSAGDQFQRAVQRFQHDATTRRVVLQLFTPADLCADTRDCSCAVSLQFLLRDGALSCLTYMRSQSALMVMPYDLFLFTMIHEALALCVGATLGVYYHFCGSLHYYEDEEDVVRAVLEANEPPPQEMPMMQDASATVRLRLVAAEQALRQQLAERPHEEVDLRRYNLDAYWTELLRAMLIGVRQRRGTPQTDAELTEVASIYRPLLAARQEHKGEVKHG